LGATRWQIARSVLLPTAWPMIFVGLRVASFMVFFTLIGAEMIGTTGGLGWLVHNSAMNYQIPGIYAAALIVTLLGLLLHQGLALAEQRLFVQTTPMQVESNVRERVARPPRRRVLIAWAAATFALFVAGGFEAWRIATVENGGKAAHGSEAADEMR
jgi:NitT/TauT family transport system permease protein